MGKKPNKNTIVFLISIYGYLNAIYMFISHNVGFGTILTLISLVFSVSIFLDTHKEKIREAFVNEIGNIPSDIKIIAMPYIISWLVTLGCIFITMENTPSIALRFLVLLYFMPAIFTKATTVVCFLTDKDEKKYQESVLLVTLALNAILLMVFILDIDEFSDIFLIILEILIQLVSIVWALPKDDA